MSRLTTSENGTGYCNAPYCQEDCNTCMFFQAIRDKLAHYEDLEEQGRLIELPCNIGDTVYIVGGKYRHGSFETWINTGKFNVEDLPKIGKTVFLTKAEAEEKLAELKGGE